MSRVMVMRRDTDNRARDIEFSPRDTKKKNIRDTDNCVRDTDISL